MPDDPQFRNKLELHDHGPEIQNVILGIIGRKGTGKSTVNKKLLQQTSAREFIFDTAGDHSWVPYRFVALDEAVLFIFESAADPSPFIGSYVPEGDDEEGLQHDFGEICKAIWESGNVTFVIEELPMMSNAQWMPPRGDRLFRLGRHRGINLVYTGQRAAETPRRATGATDIFILFHTSEPSDLDRIAERCGPECADLVANLAEHEFVVFDVRLRALLKIDERWYDSVLNGTQIWNPAVGGKHGRSALWSLDDAV